MDDPRTLQPCLGSASRKRKTPDEDSILLKEGPLTEPPIENEYENLDEEEEGDDEHWSNLGRVEFEKVKFAQEKATISRYDDIKVTPFNLDEELEEGQFDKAGNFVFRKKGIESDEGANDNWAESVDWDEVDRRERTPSEPAVNDSMDESPPSVICQSDRASCYKEMLRLMRPNETVKRTIQRLGDSIPKRKPFNKNAMVKCEDEPPSKSSIGDHRHRLDSIIELAHKRLEDGDMNIYQKSYEDLEEAIQQQ